MLKVFTVGAAVYSAGYYNKLRLVTPQCRPEPFRIAILGACGNGKSTLTNNILGKEVSEVGDFAEGVTKTIKRYYGELHGREIEVIDLPGFGD